jgi:beta-glucosidase
VSSSPELKVVVAECGTTVLKNGESAQTSLTAAMTDDSFYDIENAEVVYVSNNPAVATVNGSGFVTAQRTGVATITARVTIDGVTESGSFPVKVMPNLLASSMKVK